MEISMNIKNDHGEFNVEIGDEVHTTWQKDNPTLWKVTSISDTMIGNTIGWFPSSTLDKVIKQKK
jgi:hypothetical protein